MIETVVYTPSPSLDVWLLRWYARLSVDNELAGMLAPRFHAASAFLRHFQAPTLLRLALDTESGEVAGAMWAAPLLDVAAVGCYLVPKWRSAKEGLAFIHASIAWALGQWPTLVGWTVDPGRVRTYQKIGFKFHGVVPFGQGGQPVLMMTLTANTFAARRVRRVRMLREGVSA